MSQAAVRDSLLVASARRVARQVPWLAVVPLLMISMDASWFAGASAISQEVPTAARQPDRAGTNRNEPVANQRKLMTPETQAAIDRGLAHLAARQHEDGSFGSGRTFRGNVAVTALSGMAFLSAGHTPNRGRYGTHVAKAVDFVLAACKPNGYIIVSDNTSHGPMYGHGFATLFLAEVYGMDRRRQSGDCLRKAARLIVSTQNSEGGWRYDPEPKEADISVTVCQIMALRAARNSGVYVPKETVDRCVEYVKRCQNADGGFRYQLGRRPESLFPRSAAGVVALYSAGIYEGPEIEKGLDYLMRHVPQPKPQGEPQENEVHYFYGHYYAVQAMYQAGGTNWSQWYPAIQKELLARQLPEGSWPDPAVCNEYGTAMACLILQMPASYLPIFRR